MERWLVKTFQDVDTGRVASASVPTTVAALAQLPMPPRPLPPGRRLLPVEGTTYTVEAILTARLLERDRDVHLVLRDLASPHVTIIAEIPDPACSRPTRHGSNYATARATALRLPLGSRVRVTGIGFWDFQHGQTGVAPNAIELHPVLTVEALPPRSLP